MKAHGFGFRPCSSRRAQTIGLQAAILALLLVLALPAGAVERAVKSRINPVYPEIARRMKITGVVKLEVKVDPDGKVIDIKTLTGNRALSTAAEDAVRKWRFVPAAAESTIEVEVNFTL
jgi:TonB family protein